MKDNVKREGGKKDLEHVKERAIRVGVRLDCFDSLKDTAVSGVASVVWIVTVDRWAGYNNTENTGAV